MRVTAEEAECLPACGSSSCSAAVETALAAGAAITADAAMTAVYGSSYCFAAVAAALEADAAIAADANELRLFV